MKSNRKGFTLVEILTAASILGVVLWLAGTLAATTPKMVRKITEDAIESEKAVSSLIDLIASSRTADHCEKKTASPLQWLECDGKFAAGAFTKIRYVWSSDPNDKSHGVKKQHWDGSGWVTLSEKTGNFRIELCDAADRVGGDCPITSGNFNSLADSPRLFSLRATVELPSGHFYTYQTSVFVRNPGIDPAYTFRMNRVNRS